MKAARAPRLRTISSSVSTSRIRGTLSIRTGPDARSDAQSNGSASFLFPTGASTPPTGCPPSMTKRSPRSVHGVRRGTVVTSILTSVAAATVR